ncbi:MAG: thioredoxin family protein [Anaerolineae bacterium]|nr:thioredoxin family protein [Anaerolineae bacterium]
MTRKHLTRKKTTNKANIPLIVILGCLAVVISVILLSKVGDSKATPASTGVADSMLESFIEEGKPVFVFYHSTDCYTCKVMMATVAEIYPEFQGVVALIDVDVYDPANQNLLRAKQIRSIPTQVFYDNKGESTVIIGVMEPDALRQLLNTLTEG